MRALSAMLVLAACGDDGMMLMPDGGGGGSGTDIAAVPPGCVPARVMADRPDDHGFDQIRVLYVVPSDGVDATRDTSGQICNSVRAFASWFHAQTGLFLRFDTMAGDLDIGFVRLGRTDADLRGTDPNNNTIEAGTAFVITRIERELQMLGMLASNKLYAIYYEGSSTWACGAGAYPPLIQGRVGAMYLNGMPIGTTVPCGQSFPWGLPSLVPSYIDYGMAHELVHSMGIVAVTSPHQHSTGHVFDTGAAQPNRDLMYSPRPGQPDPGWGTNDPDGLVIDIGNDDYFESSAALDLAAMSLIAPLPANARRPDGW